MSREYAILDLTMNLTLIGFGIIGLLYSVYYYITEVKSAPYSTMGAEMSFSHYWMLSSALFCFGLCSFFNVNLLWVFLLTIVMYITSFPLRTFLSNTFMGVDVKNDKPKKGFKEFEKKISDKDDLSKSD